MIITGWQLLPVFFIDFSSILVYNIYTGVRNMRTLSEEMDSILISSILETLGKTKDCERVRDSTIAYICKSCCDIFANSKIKKDDKIDSFRNIAYKYVDDINKNIDEYKNDIEKSKKQ